MMKIEVIPLSLKEANDFVSLHHRHNKAVQGHKWSIGVIGENATMLGVAITGRPIARLLDDGYTLEILRVCTIGTHNLNSFIYGRVGKIARLMGYKKIITYTLEKESGASLRAIGASPQNISKPTGWDRPNRKRKNQEVFFEQKIRWEL